MAKKSPRDIAMQQMKAAIVAAAVALSRRPDDPECVSRLLAAVHKLAEKPETLTVSDQALERFALLYGRTGDHAAVMKGVLAKAGEVTTGKRLCWTRVVEEWGGKEVRFLQSEKWLFVIACDVVEYCYFNVRKSWY